MGKYLIDESTLTRLGDAIRTKTGGSTTLSLEQMIEAIGKISGGAASCEIGMPVGPAYGIDVYDNQAFVTDADRVDWQVGDWLLFKSHGKVGLAEITSDWGGGEYVIRPNYCQIWGVDLGIFADASVQKFVFANETQSATIVFHDGHPTAGGPEDIQFSYKVGQTLREVFENSGEYDFYANHAFGCAYFDRAGMKWFLINVQADDLIQPKTYQAIYFSE